MSRIVLSKEERLKLEHIILTKSRDVHNNTITLKKINTGYIEHLNAFLIKDICYIIVDYATQDINVSLTSHKEYDANDDNFSVIINAIIYNTLINNQHLFVKMIFKIDYEANKPTKCSVTINSDCDNVMNIHTESRGLFGSKTKSRTYEKKYV